MPMKFYVLACDERDDEKVRVRLPKEAKKQGIAGLGRFTIPRHKEERKRGNEWKTVRVRSFPGYLIFRADWSDDIHNLIDRFRGVFGVLPILIWPDQKKKVLSEEELFTLQSWTPTALDTEEEARLLIQAKEVKKKEKPTIKQECKFSPGQKITVNDGMFSGMTGIVKKVGNSQSGYFLTVDVQLLGRPTQIGVSDQQVEI